MDWFAATCGGAALYAATRWLQGTLQRRRSQTNLKGRRRGLPLKAVVANCEAKWFLQELQQAMSGDQTAMVRVSHMLLVGYGTRQDEAAAANWMRKAWAVQNFKEPADPYLQYEMLDFQNSDIPVLNDTQKQQQQQDQEEQEGLHASRLQAAAAAGAQAAAHLRQRQRRSSSGTSNTTAAAAAAAATADKVGAVNALQSSPRARAALDGGYSSSSSSGSSGMQGSNNSAAGGSKRGDGGNSRASSQAVCQLDAPLTAAATDMQLQGAELQQHTGSIKQQAQSQMHPEQLPSLVGLQQQVAAVHAVAAHGGQQQQQQQQHGVPPLQQWPVQVQVQLLCDLRSTCSPCETPCVSPVPPQQDLLHVSLSSC